MPFVNLRKSTGGHTKKSSRSENLEQIGTFWDVLEQIGTFWDIANHNMLCYVMLDELGKVVLHRFFVGAFFIAENYGHS